MGIINKRGRCTPFIHYSWMQKSFGYGLRTGVTYGWDNTPSKQDMLQKDKEETFWVLGIGGG
jgi:hypothetical protein